MDVKPRPLKFWRSFFHGLDVDIFDVIENSIIVAALDCPREFRSRRDGIAEKLFSCRSVRCLGCDNVEVFVPEGGEEEGRGGTGEAGGFKIGFCDENKEIKTNSSTGDCGEAHQVGNYCSYDEAEALTEEIEEENQTLVEVLRIKGVLLDQEEESNDVLFECLRRLELMGLTIEHLQATGIGKAVNLIQNHPSKPVRQLARNLKKVWKQLADEFIKTTEKFAEGSPDSVNPSVEDYVGLPSPPLDEGAFMAAPSTAIELSQLFEGMDDDGNLRNFGGTDKNLKNGRKTSVDDQVPTRIEQPLQKANVANDGSQIRKEEHINQQCQLSKSGSGSDRPAKKTSSEQKVNGETKPQQQRNPCKVQKKSTASSIKGGTNEISDVKLEAAKRRLYEGYQQHENAKKQRTIQVMELHDLPKQGLGNRKHFKQSYDNRNRSSVRW